MSTNKAAAPNMKGVVFRVTGIPLTATTDSLNAVISSEFEDEGITLDTTKTTICPSCYGNRDSTGFIQFKPHPPKELENLPNGDTYEIEFSPRVDISIDKDFYGLTQLYTTEEEIKADIVAVSGLNGHAYGSWRGRGNRKRMWLQDFFPDDFPNCRTMIYGYNSNLTSHSTHQISDFTEGFLEELMKARVSEDERSRPIIFIGHSFGGIVIAHSLVKAKDYGDIYDSILSNTRITIFFGTPHRGLVVDDILEMLGDNSARTSLVKSIEQQSKDLKADLRRFISCSTKFKIVSFIETGQTQRVKQAEDGRWARSGEHAKTVEDESAMLQLPREIEATLPAEGDHSTMVKFNQRNHNSYTSVVRSLNEVIFHTGINKDYTEYTAVVNNDASTLKKIFEIKQVDTNQRHGGHRATLLHLAADAGGEATVLVLLEKNFDTDARDNDSNTPLHIAASHGKEAIAEMLLVHKADSTARNNIQNTPLHTAIWKGHDKVVEVLLRCKVDITARDGNEYTPLNLAAFYGREKMVEALLSYRADSTARSNLKNTPLHTAIWKGHEKVVEVLLRYKVDITARDGSQYTPLNLAAFYGREKMVETLLRYGANTTVRSNVRNMPLHTAIWKGHDEVVEVLLRYKVDITAKDGNEYTPLHLAAFYGREKMAEMLLKGGASTKAKNNQKETPAQVASKCGHKGIAKMLGSWWLLNG